MSGSRVVFLGLGWIGSAIAARLSAFDCAIANPNRYPDSSRGCGHARRGVRIVQCPTGAAFTAAIGGELGLMGMTVANRDARAPFLRRLGRGWVIASLALSAVLYSAWLLQFPLHLDIDPVHAYVSELAAATRADHRLFAWTDLAAGLLAEGAAAITLLTGGPRRLPTRIGWFGLAGFGAATAADSLLPLPCAPHTDPGCAAREAAHQMPITDVLHLASSSAAIAALLVAIVCFTAATEAGTHTHRIGVAISVASLMTTLWTIAEVVVDDTARMHEHVGLAQRVQLLALAAGVGYIASLAASDRRRRPNPRNRRPEFSQRARHHVRKYSRRFSATNLRSPFTSPSPASVRTSPERSYISSMSSVTPRL